MQCTNCKFEILAIAKFCSECGTKVEPQGKTCPNEACNRTGLPPEALFCPDCGTKIKGSFASFTNSVNGVNFDMIAVEGGTFMMGSDENKNEKPIHAVTVSDFYIGKFPVTQKQWKAVMGNKPSKFKGENNPVENVSWFDAVAFCNKLSLLEGLDTIYKIDKRNVVLLTGMRGYRLPTDAEWEFAARGGNQSKGYIYAGSNNINEVAEYEGNNNKTTKAVGGKMSNELGLYDMSGNVWEWCQDWNGIIYLDKPQTDPTGPASGSDRVIRGGSWYFHGFGCKVAFRSGELPTNHQHSSFFNRYRGSDLGFRVVLVP